MPSGSPRSLQARFPRQHLQRIRTNKRPDKAAGYHGYWAEDLYSINSNYGSAADLKSLVSTAHAKVWQIQMTPILQVYSSITGHLCHGRCCGQPHGPRCDHQQQAFATKPAILIPLRLRYQLQQPGQYRAVPNCRSPGHQHSVHGDPQPVEHLGFLACQGIQLRWRSNRHRQAR